MADPKPTAPRAVLDAAVRAACGRAAERLTRLTRGGLNEAYRVQTRGGAPVIVRIARRPEPWFTNEAPAMARARAVGVPTPDVLGVEHVEHAGELLSLSVLSVVPGRPLDEIAHALTAQERERLVEDFGELLGRLHGATFEGGLRHGLEPPDGASVARAARAAHGALGEAAADAVERGAALVRDHAEAASAAVVCLAHGDWLPKHAMVCDGVITGVIDWEFAGAAPPARAFARWEVSAGGGLHDHAEALRRGYARVAALGAGDAALVPAFAVAWCLEVLGWRNPAKPARIRRCLEVVMRHTGAPAP